MTVTGVEGNLISELASKPALERLREAISELEPDERDLAAEGLLLGVVIDENQPDYQRGDFLVRPIVGVDPESGALAFADRVRVGQTVRLHVRDSSSATDDLQDALAAQVEALGAAGAAGALLFTCNGRGRAHVRRARPRRNRARRGVPARRRAASSAPARSARSAAATSSTDSRRRWPCSRATERRAAPA